MRKCEVKIIQPQEESKPKKVSSQKMNNKNVVRDKISKHNVSNNNNSNNSGNKHNKRYTNKSRRLDYHQSVDFEGHTTNVKIEISTDMDLGGMYN